MTQRLATDTGFDGLGSNAEGNGTALLEERDSAFNISRWPDDESKQIECCSKTR